METKRKIEILAPAGDRICLQAALDAGADAIYLGLGAFNMRQMVTRNFTMETLVDASARCRARGVKLYLTLNSLIYEGELDAMRDQLRAIKPYADAVIVADWAVVSACRDLGIPFHISTQMSCSNSESAKFLASQGASRIVLARECTLAEVKAIAVAAPGIEIETFVHGAICVAVSGRCLLSHEAYGCSASRGECHQPCRRQYLIKEIKDGEGCTAEFEVHPHQILSARDLCSLPFIDKLMEAGITSFKIEGRARNADYVKTVVAAYQEAVAAVNAGTFTPALADELVARCAKVYHRQFGVGLYHGRPGSDQFALLDENQATHKKRHVGIVMHYYPKARMAQVMIQDNPIKPGDALSIQGPNTGVVDLVVESLRRDEEVVALAARGNWVTFPCAETIHNNDKVFLVEKVE